MGFNRIARSLTVAAIAAAATIARADVDLSGSYFRLGIGADVSPKGGMSCFGLTGTHKYRLGNECDEYAEFVLNTQVFKAEDGTLFKAHVMYAGSMDFYNKANSQNVDGSYSADTTGTSVTSSYKGLSYAQLYMDVSNLPGLDAKLWIGQRYYKREDIHIMDFFYWSGQGFGVGLEDLKVSDTMRLSYTILSSELAPYLGTASDVVTGATDNALTHDLQLRGIPLNPKGSIDIGVSAAHPISETKGLESGFSATIRHVQDDIMGGNNKIFIQYGMGALGNTDSFLSGASVAASNKDAKKARIGDVLTIQPTKELGAQIALVLQHDEQNGNATSSRNWVSVGGRLTYGFAEHVKFLLEAGYDTTKTPGDDALSLVKVTPAIALSAGPGFSSRPELRLFATYAGWNDAAAYSHLAGGRDVKNPADDRSAITVGVQAESWW